jgi:hypothetical protein
MNNCHLESRRFIVDTNNGRVACLPGSTTLNKAKSRQNCKQSSSYSDQSGIYQKNVPAVSQAGNNSTFLGDHTSEDDSFTTQPFSRDDRQPSPNRNFSEGRALHQNISWYLSTNAGSDDDSVSTFFTAKMTHDDDKPPDHCECTSTHISSKSFSPPTLSTTTMTGCLQILLKIRPFLF